MSKSIEVIIVHETVLQSWVRDASTAALFIVLVGTGALLDSSAMQWVGAAVGFGTVISRSISAGNNSRMTVDQARKRLDEIDAAIGARTEG